MLAVVDHREPDRVPRDLGSVGGLLVDELYHRVRALPGLDDSVTPCRSGSSANWYDERILAALDIDPPPLARISRQAGPPARS